MTASHRPAGRDEGSVLVLMLAFAVVAVLLVAVVTDASALYLTRRSLAGSADGAALAAAQELDRVALYTGQPGEALPLDPDATLDAVRGYVSAADLESRFDDFEVVGVATDAESVTVTLRASRRLPFLGVFLAAPDGIEIEATATARAPYVD
ncbi:MAG TPA: pilus assembly protein TadG-related protein [Candidatus Limnocylindria bacterium]|nr:pilus assembly protein TadG-related protein [Candidatus Limnocylindria bacterium]